MEYRVLLVEDEKDLAMIIADILKTQGYDVAVGKDGQDGLEKFASFRPDIVVADVMMPRLDGFEMGRRIRRVSPNVPILFLTAKNTIDDIEKGFEIGGNDYLKKPFEFRELLIRIKSLLRYHHPDGKEEPRLRIGHFIFDISTQQLDIDGQCTELSNLEARVLEKLARNIGKTVDASELMVSVWGHDELSNRNSLHNYIHKLRRVLRRDPSISIINQRGFGYMLRVMGGHDR
ncbi:MAG: response regulator transcription factor [Bacteroides sp.]|nr:response regulator transcription factor [Bacteroides sp.]